MTSRARASNDQKTPSARRPRLAWPAEGLLPAIARDVATGQVLLLAWVNRESLRRTLETGIAHFWNRQRNGVWLKGESSGNVLRCVDVLVDCRGEALLFEVEPAGPACHRGTTGCFERSLVAPNGRAGTVRREPLRFGWKELHEFVLVRKQARPKGSRTARLLAAGVPAMAHRIEGDAAEAARAASVGEPGVFVGRVADLVYDLTVLMTAIGVTPEQVEELLRERHEVLERDRGRARKGSARVSKRTKA